MPQPGFGYYWGMMSGLQNGEGQIPPQIQEVMQAFAVNQTKEATDFADRVREENLKAHLVNRLYLKAKAAWWATYGLVMISAAFTLLALGFRLLGIHF